MTDKRQIYAHAVLSERRQALVAELIEVKKLRSKLRRAEERTIGRRRLTNPGSRARAVNQLGSETGRLLRTGGCTDFRSTLHLEKPQ